MWDFDCQGKIACPQQCEMDLSLTGNQKYDVEIQTGSEQQDGTTSPVYIQFIGLNGRSPKKLLRETGYSSGSRLKTTVTTMDVGKLYGIKLFLEFHDTWKVGEVIVNKGSTEVQIFDG